MRNCTKKNVDQSKMIEFDKWLKEYSKGWDIARINNYLNNYEIIVCEETGNNIWIWYAIFLSSFVFGVLFCIYSYLEHKEAEEILNGHFLSDGLMHRYG